MKIKIWFEHILSSVPSDYILYGCGVAFIALCIVFFSFIKIEFTTLWNTSVSVWKSVREIVLELISIGIVTYLSFLLFHDIYDVKIKSSSSYLYIGPLLLWFLVKAYMKTKFVRIGRGTQYDLIHNSKLELANCFGKYTEDRPPYYYPGISKPDSIETLVRKVLNQHINFISQAFLPGVAFGGHEFSLTLLYFNWETREWDIFDTFYPEGVESRNTSTWPMAKEDFKFDDKLYTYKANKIYDIIDLEHNDYESVLQIPFYLKKNYSENLRKGRVFAIASFASRKEKGFQKLKGSSSILRKYFLSELFIVEKYIYKLYRIKNN